MMKEMRANEIMKMFENQNVVNRADFTFEEYLEQLTSFQKIVSSCVYEGDDSFRLSDSITRLQQLIRSKGINDLRQESHGGYKGSQQRAGDNHGGQTRRGKDRVCVVLC